ncbi:hypothetical protein FBU59_000184 [Linderina macrospora]|uniref:Uncharacterized protein n=1 Tax=Linderina macrospora TaxID=4868 RepID=A0ACC1JHI0_9FUNG|nr:hypothetical protein FBU59_000184 [Linderina macrospora]
MLCFSATRATAAHRALRAYTTASASTFSNQSRLPRLPIPTLKDTATRYLRSLQPLLNPADYARSEKAVSEFIGPTGLGPVLQQRLQQVDAASPYSWLEDIWLKKAYLEWREPSYINVNWFAAIADNPDFPVTDETLAAQRVSAVQIARAARLVVHVLEFNDSLNRGELAPEMSRAGPLCMNQYKSQFGTTRIARETCDQIISQYPSTSKHFLLMYRDQPVSVPVYNASGERASLAQITAQIANAVKHVDELLATQPNSLPSVAQLTAGHRDDWTKGRALLEQDADNRKAFAVTDDALFGVSLDVHGEPEQIATPEGCAAAFCHSEAGRNRWYDKAFQLIVLRNGRAGVNGEHAPVDALTTGRIAMEAAMKERGPYKDSAPISGLSEPSVVHWNVPSDVVQIIDKVRGDSAKLAQNLRIRLGNANEFGASWIKTLGVSPDAFFQLALQVAYFRQHGRPAPTYETASLRAFLHGRTETIRSCTPEAWAFAKAFDDRDVKLGTKIQLLRQAVDAHIEYTRAAAAGQGVDRHLLGLRVQIQDEGEAARASLFADPAYIQSMSFAMSTSNVSPGDLFRGGFAPVIADGYGINYALDKNDLKFTVSDWVDSSATDAEQLRQSIYQTLADLHEAGEFAKSRN